MGVRHMVSPYIYPTDNTDNDTIVGEGGHHWDTGNNGTANQVSPIDQ